MKKIAAAICLLLLPALTTRAQFTFPTVPEHIFPAANLNIGVADETSCHHVKVVDYDLSGPQNLYVYAWSGSGHSYLAWRRDNDDNTVTFDENFFPMSPNYRNIEVGIYQPGAMPWVVVAYYNTDPGNPGHFYEIYEFTPGGLVQVLSPQPLSSAPTYGRISLDVHSLDEVIMVWRDNQIQRLVVKIINNSGPVASKVIANTNNAVSPDIAAVCNGEPYARIVYFDQGTGQIVVASKHLQLLGASASPVTFNVDDVNLPAVAPQNFDHASLNIDCPVHFRTDDWSYIYTDNSGLVVKSRVRTHPGGTPTTNTYSLSQGLFGPVSLANSHFYTTGVAYSNQGNSIYYGWYFGDGNPGDPNSSAGASGWYVAVELANTGTPVVNEYQCIINPLDQGINYTWHPGPVAFSKKTETNDHLFIAYPMVSGPGSGNPYMATKFIRWGQTSFRPGEGTTSVHSLHEDVWNLNVAPNPFRDQVLIDLQGVDPRQEFNVRLCDISGRQIMGMQGKADIIKDQVAAQSKALMPGMYLLQVTAGGKNKTFKLLKSY